MPWTTAIFKSHLSPKDVHCTLTHPFPDLSVSSQTTRRGSWRVAEAGRSRTRPSSTCPSSSLTASRPAPAPSPSECAAATRRATSCRATLRRIVCPQASAEERSSPSWPASLSCWVSYDLLLGGYVERSQRPVVSSYHSFVTGATPVKLFSHSTYSIYNDNSSRFTTQSSFWNKHLNTNLKYLHLNISILFQLYTSTLHLRDKYCTFNSTTFVSSQDQFC